MIQFDEPAFNVFMDEVRDWGIKALERAAEGPDLRHRRPHLLRLRHQGQYRLEADARAASGGSMRRSFRRSPKARSSRSRSNAATRRCRWTCSALLTGKVVQAGVIDVASDTVETAEDVAKVIDDGLEIRAEEQHRRDHQLRHGADAARYRGSQTDGARRRREAGAGSDWGDMSFRASARHA